MLKAGAKIRETRFVLIIKGIDEISEISLDHFGMSVGTPGELLEMLERARKFQERDPRVEIDDHEVEDFKVLKLHNFYVRYLLPLRIEVQCYEWAEGFSGESQPES